MEKKMIRINAVGDTCPIPIVKAKHAIRELQGSGEVEILVDNEIAVQNLTKMARQKGYGVQAGNAEGQTYKVILTINEAEDNSANVEKDAGTPKTEAVAKNIVIAIPSTKMGEGDEIAGGRLMKSFLYSLSEQEILPSAILFYNSGALLTCGGSQILEELKTLEAMGVEMLTCGTCLDFYGTGDTFCVGSATNMYTITEKMLQADLVIKP